MDVKLRQSRRNCVSRQTSRKSGFASKEMGCSFRRSSLTGHRSSRCRWTYQMTFWTTATIHFRSHATRYDGLHAGYRYLQLQHQAPTSDTAGKIRETRRGAQRVRDYGCGIAFWCRAGGPAETRRADRGVLGSTCDSRLDQRSYTPLCTDSLRVGESR